MVAEMRALYADLANRRHFTEPKKPIADTRKVLDELSAPPVIVAPAIRAAQSATHLKSAAESGFIEVG